MAGHAVHDHAFTVPSRKVERRETSSPANAGLFLRSHSGAAAHADVLTDFLTGTDTPKPLACSQRWDHTLARNRLSGFILLGFQRSQSHCPDPFEFFSVFGPGLEFLGAWWRASFGIGGDLFRQGRVPPFDALRPQCFQKNGVA